MYCYLLLLIYYLKSPSNQNYSSYHQSEEVENYSTSIIRSNQEKSNYLINF